MWTDIHFCQGKSWLACIADHFIKYALKSPHLFCIFYQENIFSAFSSCKICTCWDDDQWDRYERVKLAITKKVECKSTPPSSFPGFSDADGEVATVIDSLVPCLMLIVVLSLMTTSNMSSIPFPVLTPPVALFSLAITYIQANPVVTYRPVSITSLLAIQFGLAQYDWYSRQIQSLTCFCLCYYSILSPAVYPNSTSITALEADIPPVQGSV